MHCEKEEPWSPTDATYSIREIGNHPALSIAYKVHATQRLAERGVLTPDILYLLRKGFVYERASPSKTPGYFKYEVVGTTPNSNGRKICAIVAPNAKTMTIKIITVMWVDEKETQAGTLKEGA